MDFSPEQIRNIVVGVFVLLVSVAVHEFGHAIVAYKLGDDTPKRQGRVTLNPLAHADPIGTFLLPVVGAIYMAGGGGAGGFGWGKPVQWQPSRVRRGISMTKANVLVSIAGPGMNLVLAFAIALVGVILETQGVLTPGEAVWRYVWFAVTTNFVLMFFNLLPVPPLDGGHATEALIPYKHRAAYQHVARFGPFIILAFMMIPPFAKVFLLPAMWCRDSVRAGLMAIFA